MGQDLSNLPYHTLTHQTQILHTVSAPHITVLSQVGHPKKQAPRWSSLCVIFPRECLRICICSRGEK